MASQRDQASGYRLTTRVDAQPFVPGGGSSGASAVSAKAFVPASAAAAAAKPFIPASATSQAPLTANIAAAAPVPDHSNLGLPDDDDILGLSSATPASAASDIASQAAQMFRSWRPMQQQPGAGPPPSGTLASSNGGPPPGLQHPFSQGGKGRGGGGGGGPSGGPPPGPGGRFSGGRGRGRGGRGRGGRAIGPGVSRPSVAAYAVSYGRMQLAGQFMPESLRQDMQQRSYLAAATLPADALAAAGLPAVVQQFHSLLPLEDLEMASETPSTALGISTCLLKGVHTGDGAPYALRRIDGRHLRPTADVLATAETAVERWAPVSNHTNVVGLREAFVSDEVDGMPSLFLAFDYHAAAVTLEQAHILPTHTPQGLMRSPASEAQLWSYLVQLTAALRAIHSAGLAASPAALAPSKVVLVAPSRVRLAAVGVAEVLAEGPPADVNRAQREDLTALGTMLLTLACAARNAPPSLDALSAHYSRELCHVMAGLLASSEGGGFASWRSLVAALGDRIFSELDSAHSQCDTVASELQKECENGRIARLLIKMNMVLDRPEMGGDARWAETGDRYLLSLFRDFVFHQVQEDGSPATDWGPMIEALNKADAGVDEKVVLLSRDEASMLVVSYADVKRCLQTAYAELKAAAVGTTGGGGEEG